MNKNTVLPSSLIYGANVSIVLKQFATLFSEHIFSEDGQSYTNLTTLPDLKVSMANQHECAIELDRRNFIIPGIGEFSRCRLTISRKLASYGPRLVLRFLVPVTEKFKKIITTYDPSFPNFLFQPFAETYTISDKKTAPEFFYLISCSSNYESHGHIYMPFVSVCENIGMTNPSDFNFNLWLQFPTILTQISNRTKIKKNEINN